MNWYLVVFTYVNHYGHTVEHSTHVQAENEHLAGHEAAKEEARRITIKEVYLEGPDPAKWRVVW